MLALSKYELNVFTGKNSARVPSKHLYDLFYNLGTKKINNGMNNFSHRVFTVVRGVLTNKKNQK